MRHRTAITRVLPDPPLYTHLLEGDQPVSDVVRVIDRGWVLDTISTTVRMVSEEVPRCVIGPL